MMETDQFEDTFRSIEFIASDIGINKYGTNWLIANGLFLHLRLESIDSQMDTVAARLLPNGA